MPSLRQDNKLRVCKRWSPNWTAIRQLQTSTSQATPKVAWVWSELAAVLAVRLRTRIGSQSKVSIYFFWSTTRKHISLPWRCPRRCRYQRRLLRWVLSSNQYNSSQPDSWPYPAVSYTGPDVPSALCLHCLQSQSSSRRTDRPSPWQLHDVAAPPVPW